MVLLPSALRVARHSGTGVRGASDRVISANGLRRRKPDGLAAVGDGPQPLPWHSLHRRSSEIAKAARVCWWGQGKGCQETDFPDRFSDGLIRVDRRTLEPLHFLRSGRCWNTLHSRLQWRRTPCVWGPTASRLYSPGVPRPQLCWHRCFNRFSLRPAAIRLLAWYRSCPVGRA